MSSENSKISDEVIWRVIDKYFTDNPDFLVRHHLNSYNDFFNSGLSRMFKEKNPINIMKQQDEDTKDFRLKCQLYLGGKEGTRIYYGKPIIYDEDRSHYMYPNEARLRNMTYGMTIHYDVEVDFSITLDTPDPETGATEFTDTAVLEKVYLGRFPIMLMSKYCILNGFNPEVRFNMGECRNDQGGYFIIDGKEKVIVSQEKFADNMLYVKEKVNDEYLFSAEIRSVSEDASKPIRTMAVRMVAPSPTTSNKQIVVTVPNVRKPVPLFILMRALGIESDKDIIRTCLLDMESNSAAVDMFIPSVHDAGKIFSRTNALQYIATLTKGKTIPHVLEILSNYLLPHVGEMNFYQKAMFIGYMTNEMMLVARGIKKPTDRDSFMFKRVELPGSLMYDLVREYYTLQQRNIYQKIDKEYYYHEGVYQGKSFMSLVLDNYREQFKERIVEDGVRKAFKGNWGAEPRTKRSGIVQDLNRLSFNSFLSHLRKINLPLDSSAKVVGPRVLHSSQWGIIDPVDTPDGGNVGLHKHMTLVAQVTSHCSGKPMETLLRNTFGMLLLEECRPEDLSRITKVFVNGNWIGAVEDPVGVESTLKDYRRSALIPYDTSIHWHIASNSLYVYTDSGRLCRPILYMNKETSEASLANDAILEKIKSGDFTWSQLIRGFAPTKKEYSPCTVYSKVSDLYNSNSLDELDATKAIVEFIDTAEEESAFITVDNNSRVTKTHPYTHAEIHPSLLLGVMGNQVVFPENNPLPRDLFACGQGKQAVSLYHSNYLNRIDKMGVVLNAGQMPLVKSRYAKYINREQHPYGENAIVAIMVYGGYNVEDSILFNEGSVKRGLFRTTYYNSYEAREEASKVKGSDVDKRFADIEKQNVIGMKPGYDYSYLNEHGLIKENTPLDDKKVLIGRVTTDLTDPDVSMDSSVFPKKGQLGVVDKTFITEGQEGFRIAKVRIREERVPAIGDKFCSRCGQKGTVGLIIPERDMPFTDDGIRPDLIINPHALPSRMTIGQLVETHMGKACLSMGGYGDCTAFANKGPKNHAFGEMLVANGYHSSGNQVLYNGQTGEQLTMEIFIGPTYYMRLKHMVKDKINYRGLGPRTVLTRQTVQGRANDGGLRIGEMERDSLISHGMTSFLKESMLVRGDDYNMAICNQSGTIAIYNESQNLFMSPMVDGPLEFVGNLESGLNVVNKTRFGRNFSVVRVPYAFKLLMQELTAMNVQMRIITEDNIDSLTTLVKTNNIGLLMHKEEATGKTVMKQIQQNRDALNKELRKINNMVDSSATETLGRLDDVVLPTLGADMAANMESEYDNSMLSPHSPDMPTSLDAPADGPVDGPIVFSPHSPDMPPPLDAPADGPIVFSPHSPDMPPPSDPILDIQELSNMEGDDYDYGSEPHTPAGTPPPLASGEFYQIASPNAMPPSGYSAYGNTWNKSTNPIDETYITQSSMGNQPEDRYDNPYVTRNVRPVPKNMPAPPVSQFAQKGGVEDVTHSILMPLENTEDSNNDGDKEETKESENKKSVTIAIDTSGNK